LMSLSLMIYTHGAVSFLVVLYSINVFITFSLSQLGMVRHWWNERHTTKGWKKKILVNGIGLAMTLFILVSVTVIKFFEGGWLTIIITGTLITLALLVKSHYNHAFHLLQKFQSLADATILQQIQPRPALGKGPEKGEFSIDLRGKTAVLLVNGFNGQGMHTLLHAMKMFDNAFKNFVFLQVGMIDAGNFKGVHEVETLEKHVRESVQKYVGFMKTRGYHAEAACSIAVDVVEETMKLSEQVKSRFPNATFFGGQLVFPEDTFVSRWLHNYVASSVQRRFFLDGVSFVLIPAPV
ncbi:MAG TPA: amino acid transporter, partial [Candidatus Ozemobacteraceae bacterium]|nr:amino acid transporter [Candidatus Ozemobacteraceae bacterium]